ncbi:type I-E CRISPR-associated protein Cse1/CasA [Solihabitans fulvus]|uniref:Type I-E CRISPR-associated protein Cse1/CasA n=1 Tax=Solihabitans fulvus TaxID=1892852 RepID=A0A5B2W3A5_9PSEU|nr:type I-E CRISPR-associated protein Cse1/CasA [Solihabitans fulvus]KAA2246403.1 type I-E CRISPR-associated protein Cse1/CasA [Solihabitans fulvus]
MVTAEPTPAFDLLTQPWIPVIDLRGERCEVGLIGLLHDAHRIRRIVGDTPPMTAALHRLVLAFLHRSYGPSSEQAWATLWSAPQLPRAPVDNYVADKRDRFDLFDPVQPFLQCPALKGLAPSTAAKLVPHRAVGNNVTLFDHTTATDKIVLSQAESARWLVTAHAFDPGGMKTPYEKDKSSERAPCNLLGVVLVEGATLKETLLLNALIYAPKYAEPFMTYAEDRPAWEEPIAPMPQPDSRVGRGWTDVLTWPSRRILLSRGVVDGNPVVDGVTLTPGVRFKGKPVDEEKMAAFRQPVAANGKPKADAPMLPVRLSPLRGVWRHSVELLLTDVWQEGRSRLRPRALEQIATLAAHQIIPRDAVYTLRVFGQQLDKNAAVVEAYLEEQVPAPVSLLRAEDQSLGALIGTAIALADDAGAALRNMERDYLKDQRAEPTSGLDLAYWPPLDRTFATFLRELGRARAEAIPETDAVAIWAKEIERTAQQAADRWAEGVPAVERNLLMLGKHHGDFLRRLDRLVSTFHREVRNYITREDQQE